MRSRTISEAELRSWCIDRVANLVGRPAAEIEPDASFAELGLDSATSVHLVMEIEDFLSVELIPEVVFEHPTIAELVAFLLREAN